MLLASQAQGRLRDLALFDLEIDSKLRASDLVKLCVGDVCHGGRLAGRAMVLQQRTRTPPLGEWNYRPNIADLTRRRSPSGESRD